MEEIWKVIDEYPDYMVSNMGRIKSLKLGKEKRLMVMYGVLLMNMRKYHLRYLI